VPQISPSARGQPAYLPTGVPTSPRPRRRPARAVVRPSLPALIGTIKCEMGMILDCGD